MELFLRLLRDYIRPYWSLMAVALLLSGLASAHFYILGYLTQITVDDILQINAGDDTKARPHPQEVRVSDDRGRLRETTPPRDNERPNRHAPPKRKSEREKVRLLVFIFFAYLAVRVFFTGIQWIYSYQVTYVGQRVVFHIRRQLHEKLQSLQVTYFDRQQTGKLMSRVLDDVGVIQQNVTHVFVDFVANVFRLLIGCCILATLNWKLAIIAFLTLPFYAVTYQTFRTRIRESNRTIRRQIAEIYGLLEERVAGIRVILSFARERAETLALHKKLSRLMRQRVVNTTQNTMLTSLSTFISAVGTAFVLYFGAYLVRAGDLTVGELLFFNQSLINMFEPITALAQMNIQVQWIIVVVNRIFEILDEDIKIKDAPNALRLDRVRGRVTFQDVSLRYSGAIRDALSRISFDVPPGTSVSIVGPSGSGKSSLVSLLLRLYDPTDGRILIDGHDLRDIKLSSLRQHIGFVPQEPILFSGTIAENITYGRFDAAPDQIMAAARAAELHDFVMTLPDKYESPVGERGANLSGGQKQRMAFAMALLTDPSILILDDTTSALDAETEAKIQKTLERIMEGRTTFIITHRISTAMRADTIVVLDNGRVADVGTHEELISREGLYFRMYEQQRSGVVEEVVVMVGDEVEAARLEGIEEEERAEVMARPARLDLSPSSS